MSVNKLTVFYLLLGISLISLVATATDDQSLDPITYGDDEDLSDFSGSGDSQGKDEVDSPKESAVTTNIERTGVGKVIDLTLPSKNQVQLKPDENSKFAKASQGTVHVKLSENPVETKSIRAKDSKVSKKTDKKQRKSESPARGKKYKKTDKKSKKKKKLMKKSKKKGKTLKLSQSKSSVKLKPNKDKNENSKNNNGDKNYHIRRNLYENGHSDKPRRRHEKSHHKKRWRKNMDSNRHGYGSKGTSKKKKKLTFEDRWPGCFSKYESCYRDSNCCNKHCHQFSWLSFGFCL